MTVECPNCHAKYTLDEKMLAGRSNLQLKCAKCRHSFSIATASTGAAEAKPIAPRQSSATTTVTAREGTVQAHPADATRVSRIGSGGGGLPHGKVVALSVTQGPNAGRVFRLDKPQIVIGRRDADVVIEDPEISRKHCAVQVNGTSATLMDLGTTNGTFVEGQRITAHELHHLSEFRIGATTLMFTVTNKDAESEHADQGS